jgi:hypothetical protein
MQARVLEVTRVAVSRDRGWPDSDFRRNYRLAAGVESLNCINAELYYEL